MEVPAHIIGIRRRRKTDLSNPGISEGAQDEMQERTAVPHRHHGLHPGIGREGLIGGQLGAGVAAAHSGAQASGEDDGFHGDS